MVETLACCPIWWAKAFGKVEVCLQPCVVLKMLESPNDLPPIGYAFTTLRWISTMVRRSKTRTSMPSSAKR